MRKKKYCKQPEWSSWTRPEEELHLSWRWQELKFDDRWFKIQTTEEYGNTDKESFFNYICYFFEGLTPDEKETLRKLVFAVYEMKEFNTYKYKDYTDGFEGFDFEGKLEDGDDNIRAREHRYAKQKISGLDDDELFDMYVYYFDGCEEAVWPMEVFCDQLSEEEQQEIIDGFKSSGIHFDKNDAFVSFKYGSSNNRKEIMDMDAFLEEVANDEDEYY